MKATDLMVGDWMTYPVMHGRASGQIKTAWSDGVVEIGERCWREVDKEIQPIPITPEILEHNGFEEDIRTDAWGKPLTKARNWKLCEELDEGDFGYVFYISLRLYKGEWLLRIETNHRQSFNGIISYIHELQHAFKLCGITKEIVL